MKVAIVLFAVAVSCVSAGYSGGYGAVGPVAAGYGAAISTGSSSQFRSEDNYGNYQFGYDESHATGSTGRREERHGDVVRGSYRLGDADGRQRTVNYVADHSGFHASIHTNEPGVDAARDPADTLINKEGYAHGPVAAVAPVAPVAPVYAAPAPIAHPLPAAPVYRAPVASYNRAYTAPAPIIAPAPAPVYEQAPVYEAPAPRGFSYSFGASHPVHMSYAAPAPLAIQGPAYGAPAPVQQYGLKY